MIEKVSLEFWDQETIESGRWRRLDNLDPEYAQKIIEERWYPNARLVPPPEPQLLQYCSFCGASLVKIGWKFKTRYFACGSSGIVEMGAQTPQCMLLCRIRKSHQMQIDMLCSRLGNSEKIPEVCSANFLQRVDELRDIEFRRQSCSK